MLKQSLTQSLLVLTLLASALLAPAAYAQQPLAPGPAARPVAQGNASGDPTSTGEPFVRTELFFGADKPGGGTISKEAFRRFLKEEITRRFPDGLTVLTGTGQFRDAERGKITRERSMLLILLYPVAAWKESDAKIEQIRQLYKDRFQQQSVLRIDAPWPVRVSF